MSRSISVKQLPPTFKFVARNKLLPVFLLFLSVLAPAVLRADTSERTVTRGNTFTIERPRDSTFLKWTIDSFDARKLSLRETTMADTVGRDRFQFEALETGESTINLVLEQSTVFGNSVASTETIVVNVVEPGVSTGDRTGDNSDGSGAPRVSDETVERLTEDPEESSPSPPSTAGTDNNGRADVAGLDREEWDQAQELIETERYEAARNIIEEQIQDARGTAKQRWQNELARTYMEQGQYEQAANQWEAMVEEFSNGPVAEWKYKAARAYREAGMNDQAELTLLEIRHRHRQAEQWVNAMIEMGEIAIDRGNYDRARSILETARKPLEDRDNPRLTLRLARMYDDFEPIRDYERAVRLYQSAGEALRDSDPEVSQEALDRAEYLRENYVNFGF